MHKPKAIVIGAGFAGIHAAKNLSATHKVVIVNPEPCFYYTPLIHELLSEQQTLVSIRKPIKDVLPNAEIFINNAIKITGNTVELDNGNSLTGDLIIAAMGAEVNYRNIPGAKEHTVSFYHYRDALRVNSRVKELIASGKNRLNIVICGGGFTGVEVAGEINCLITRLGCESQTLILDAGSQLFALQTAAFREAAMQRLNDLNIQVKLNQQIRQITNTSVETTNDNYAADLIIWCGGNQPRTIPGLDNSVNSKLQSLSNPKHYVVGDCAMFSHAKIPKLAQTAQQQGVLVAQQILGKNINYELKLKGIIMSIGPDYAIAELSNKQVLTGKIPWHIKRQLYRSNIRSL